VFWFAVGRSVGSPWDGGKPSCGGFRYLTAVYARAALKGPGVATAFCGRWRHGSEETKMAGKRRS
jgi:hypothetical protein